MSMDVHVGARLETIEPTAITDYADRKYLACLILFAVVLHFVIVVKTKVTARDSLEFARIALQIKNPQAVEKKSFIEVLSDPNLNKQHPGYPFAILAADSVVHMYYGEAISIQQRMIRSAQAASCFAAVLIVFPSYWLGRILFSKQAGFAAALLFQALPGVAHKTSDGLSEALYMLMVSSTLLFAVTAVRTPSIGRFLVCGLGCGAAYLVRPEGLALGLATSLVMLGLMFVRKWSLSETFGRLTALAIGCLILAGPYMVVIGGVTKKPSAGDMLRAAIDEPGFATKGPLFAAWYDPSKDEPLALWVIRAFCEETLKMFFYLPAIPAAIGYYYARRRFRAEPWFWVPIVFTVLMAVILLRHASSGHVTGEATSYYLSERHTIPLVFVGCLFAGYGLEMLPELSAAIPRSRLFGWPAISNLVLAGLVLYCLPKATRPEHTKRIGHVQAGQFLKDILRDEDTLVDPFEWAQFYAGRTIYRIPPDPNRNVTYAVVETKDDDEPHSVLPRRKTALNVMKDHHAVRIFQSDDELVEVWQLTK